MADSVGPTADGFKIEIPNALLAMVTGGFYVYHLDNAEFGSRPSRSWELGGQTVLTALCGLIAACATGELIFGSAGTVFMVGSASSASASDALAALLAPIGRRRRNLFLRSSRLPRDDRRRTRDFGSHRGGSCCRRSESVNGLAPRLCIRLVLD